uniref:G protein-coupled receptor n=1 Tax=Haemonchus contortus TaxID=6289 RepID=A0A7I4YA53_HAECO
MEYNDLNPFIVHCYYAIFVTLALSTNGLLIYLIRYKSPNIVRSLKAMLINMCAMQILTALTAALLQGRLIASGSSIAILSEGPLCMFGPMAGLIAFNITIATTFYIELSRAHTVFWRYRMLQLRQMNKVELLLSFAMIVIWPLLILVLSLTESPQFDIVMKDAIRLHRNYNLVRYGEFGGFEPKSPNQTICVFSGTVTAITSPILILYLRRLILKTFDNSNHQYSEKTVQSSKMFLKALTMQAMLPILSFVPASLFATLALASGSETPISEYLSISITTLPCVIDPLIAFYFVPPYRAWVLRKLCKRSTPIKAESTWKSITSSNPLRAPVITAVV